MRKRTIILLSIILVIVMACGALFLIAYNQGWLDTHSPEYESEYLQPYGDENYAKYQGAIKQVLPSGISFKAIYDGRTIHDQTAVEQEIVWSKWEIGARKDIIVFDDNVLVVEDEDGALIAYVSMNRDASKTKDLKKVELGCDRDDFVHCFFERADKELVCVYKNEGVCYCQIYSLSTNKISEPKQLVCELEDGTAVSVKEFHAKGFGNAWGVLAEDNGFYNAQRAPRDAGDRVFLQVHDEMEIFTNVDRYWVTGTYGDVISLIDDDVHLYCRGAKKVREDSPYTNVDAQINLPDGYTTANIVEVQCLRTLLVLFDDGAYYTALTSEMRANAQAPVELNKLTGFENLLEQGHVIQVMPHGNSVLVLMDDGYLYEPKESAE